MAEHPHFSGASYTSTMRDPYESEHAVRTQTPFVAARAALDEEIAGLREVVEILEERVRPALSPAYAAADPSDDGDRLEQAPILDSIGAATDQVAGLRRRLAGLADRIVL